jgi:hypothetical protein
MTKLIYSKLPQPNHNVIPNRRKAAVRNLLFGRWKS